MATDVDLDGIDFGNLNRAEILSALLDAVLLDADADFAAPPPDGRGRLAASFAGPPDQPRDERGRWTTTGAALAAANPMPKDRPPPAPLFPEPGNVTHAAAVRANAEHGVAYHRARTAEVVRRMLTEPDAPAVPVPPADAPKGKRVAAARKAVELAAAAKDDLRQLTNPHPEAVAANRAVAASHPHGVAALEAARAEAARRHAAAKAVVEAHIAALPDDLRAKARKAAEAAFAAPERSGAIREGVEEEDGRGRLAEFYSPDQPRDDRGRWSEGAGSGAARLHYAEAVRQFARAGGPASASEVAAVAGHLSRLTVAQLHDLRREHGLRASSPDKAGLVKKLAERFAAHRAADGAKPAEKQAAAAPNPLPAKKNAVGAKTPASPHPSGATINPTHDGYHVVRSSSGMALKAFKDRGDAERFRDALPAHKPADAADRAAREKDAAARRLAAAEAAAREHPHREDVRDELRAARGAAGASKPPGVRVGNWTAPGVAPHEVKPGMQVAVKHKQHDTPLLGTVKRVSPASITIMGYQPFKHSDIEAIGRTDNPAAGQTAPPPPDARGRLSVGPVNPMRDKPATSEVRHSADAVQRMSVAELRDAATRTQGGRLSPGVHAHIHAMAEAERRLKTGKDSRGAAISEGEKERLQRSLVEGKAKLGRLLRGERAAFAAEEEDGRGRLTAAFASDDEGRWVTIQGVHVHVGKDGKIDKGPAHLIGKSHALMKAAEAASKNMMKSSEEKKKEASALSEKAAAASRQADESGSAEHHRAAAKLHEKAAFRHQDAEELHMETYIRSSGRIGAANTPEHQAFLAEQLALGKHYRDKREFHAAEAERHRKAAKAARGAAFAADEPGDGRGRFAGFASDHPDGWYTIGGGPGPHGEQHAGGTAVYIEAGKIAKGPANLVGHAPDAIPKNSKNSASTPIDNGDGRGRMTAETKTQSPPEKAKMDVTAELPRMTRDELRVAHAKGPHGVRLVRADADLGMAERMFAERSQDYMGERERAEWKQKIDARKAALREAFAAYQAEEGGAS